VSNLGTSPVRRLLAHPKAARTSYLKPFRLTINRLKRWHYFIVKCALNSNLLFFLTNLEQLI